MLWSLLNTQCTRFWSWFCISSDSLTKVLLYQNSGTGMRVILHQLMGLLTSSTKWERKSRGGQQSCLACPMILTLMVTIKSIMEIPRYVSIFYATVNPCAWHFSSAQKSTDRCVSWSYYVFNFICRVACNFWILADMLTWFFFFYLDVRLPFMVQKMTRMMQLVNQHKLFPTCK